MRHVFHYAILALVVCVVVLFWARRGQLFPKPLTDLALVYEDTSTPAFSTALRPHGAGQAVDVFDDGGQPR